MTLRTLFDRLLEERPATQEADTWRGIQTRLASRRRRWILLTVAAAATLAVIWFRPQPAAEDELYLYIARTDRPSSEALELSLKESP